jgi:hypothetical protein
MAANSQFRRKEKRSAEIGRFRAESAEPKVRIHLAPPSSPSVFVFLRESLEIRARAVFLA